MKFFIKSKTQLLFLLCMLITQILIGNVHKIDSLKMQLESSQIDSLTFVLLDQISWQYLQINLDSAEKYNSIFIKKASKNHQQDFLSIGFNTSGVIKWYRGNMEEV